MLAYNFTIPSTAKADKQISTAQETDKAAAPQIKTEARSEGKLLCPHSNSLVVSTIDTSRHYAQKRVN